MPKGLHPRFEHETSFRLGEWLVEPDLNLIRRGEEIVHLECKVMELLVFLASRGSRLVTRRELVDGVWGTEFICDNTLTHAVAELRAALGDDAHAPRFIQTIHRRGYRLLAPVTSVEGRSLIEAGSPSSYRVISGARSIQLREGINLIGRAPEATVRVDSIWVSRHHAQILVATTAATIEDLGSRNGTFVNGRPLDRPQRLVLGDSIFLGTQGEALQFVEARSGAQVTTDPLPERTPIPPAFEA